MIIITFPDGKSESFKSGVTSHEIASSISEGLARNILVSKVNGKLVDINA
jgi:threonyl-tRNA synthetase